MTTTQGSSDSERLSRLEVTVDYLVREVGDIKAELRQIRTESREDNRSLRDDYRAMLDTIDRNRQESRRDFRVLVGIIVATMVATWALIGSTLLASL